MSFSITIQKTVHALIQHVNINYVRHNANLLLQLKPFYVSVDFQFIVKYFTKL